MSVIIIPRNNISVPVGARIDVGNHIGGKILGGVSFAQGVSNPYRMYPNTGSGAPPLVSYPSMQGGSEFETKIENGQFDDYLFEDGNFFGEDLDWTVIAMARYEPEGALYANRNLVSIRVGAPAESTPFVSISSHYTSGLRAYHRGTAYAASDYFKPYDLTPVATVFRNGSSISFYCGSNEPSLVATSASGFYGGLNYQSGIFFGSYLSGGRAAFGYAIPEALDDVTLREWCKNPYQIFKKPESVRIYILGTTPVSNTIDLSGVSFGMASFPTTQTAVAGLSYIDVGVSPATLQAIFGANLGSVPVLLSPKNTQLSNTLGVGESGIGMGVGDLTFPESNNIEMIGSSFDMGEENVELKQQASVGSTSFNVDGTDTSAYQRLVFSATNIDFNTGLLDLPLIITNGSSQLNDAIFFKLRSMGYEGSLNKMVHKYFLDNGASDKVSVMQAEREWLVALGVTETVSVRDMYKAHLSASGYSGTFNDALLKFWNDV